MTDATGVPFQVLSDVLSDPTALLFGLEAEFSVLSVDRIGPSAVKLIIEQISRAGPCPACGVLSSAVKDRSLVRVEDLPACGQQVELWCANAGCGAGSRCVCEGRSPRAVPRSGHEPE